jgi:hypothetical protein
MLVVLCGTVSSVVGAAVAGLLHDTRPSRARGAAEAFALQLRQQFEKQSEPQNSANTRAPASVESPEEMPPLTGGQIGRDPWGRPYQYSVLSSHTDQRPVVLVWSTGPNGQPETDTSSLTQDDVSEFRFHGDDLGYLDRGPASGVKTR